MNLISKIKTTRIASGFFIITRHMGYLASVTNHPNGGVRGGTIRLLPVDSKAEAKCSSLYPSQEPPAQTNPKLK